MTLSEFSELTDSKIITYDDLIKVRLEWKDIKYMTRDELISQIIMYKLSLERGI
ncbi:MAG: hypothetical protein ACOCP8_00885 [archaeon]